MSGKTMKQRTAKQRALAWIVGRHVGLSSKAIWAQMMGAGTPEDGWSYPHDPDDLSRCLRLLRLMPEWRRRLPEMAKRDPVWRALVKRWAELEALMEEEVGWDWSKGRSAPRTYAMMKEIGA